MQQSLFTNNNLYPDQTNSDGRNFDDGTISNELSKEFGPDNTLNLKGLNGKDPNSTKAKLKINSDDAQKSSILSFSDNLNIGRFNSTSTSIPSQIPSISSSFQNQIFSSTEAGSGGESRERILQARLDSSLSSKAKGTLETEAIDAGSYLNELAHASNSLVNSSQVADLERAKILFQAAIKANPNSPTAWISAARVEEAGRKMKVARDVIARALIACPASEEVWIEASRLALPNERIPLLERATSLLGSTSSTIWLALADAVEFDKNSSAVAP
jgi:hypothetical protein